MRMSFSGPKWPICPEQHFFGTKHYYYFHRTFGPFYCAKFLKKFLKRIQSYEDAPFLGPKWSICPEQNFFWKKIINIFFIYLLAPFVVQNFKNFFSADPELWGCTILGSKMDHLPKWEFFRKPANKPYSFQSCLSTCQKSKSDINLLMKYRQLKNTEISLAKSHFRL